MNPRQITTLAAVLCCMTSYAQLSYSGPNYVAVSTYNSVSSVSTDVTYYDGLGYPVQQVQDGAGGSGVSVVTPIVYDSMLRSDGRRGLTIEYNLLNLPSEVTGTVNGTTMTAYYKYLPDGTKLSTADNSGSGFAYLGSLVYRKDGSSYTFGARFYDDEICRWTTIDPLAKKYFSMTPYNYCGNDPVNFVDPDGRVVVFDDDCTEEFKAKFAEAIQYMNEKGTSYNFAKLQESKEVYTIKEDSNSTYIIEDKTITWNPNVVSVSKSGIMRSPVTTLAHEAGHAIQHDSAIKEGNEAAFIESSKNGTDPNYDSISEKEVITKIEQYAAKKHGEISDWQVTRTNHSGKSFRIITINGKSVDLSGKQQSWISKYVGTYNQRIK